MSLVEIMMQKISYMIEDITVINMLELPHNVKKELRDYYMMIHSSLKRGLAFRYKT